jgi:uncharacterized iron-regulated membrane protein
MSPRKVLFQLHWIIGITAGIVLAIVGATGALLSFEQQIVASLGHEGREVEAAGRTSLSAAELLTRVSAEQQDKRIVGLSIATSIPIPAHCSRRLRAALRHSSATCVGCIVG